MLERPEKINYKDIEFGKELEAGAQGAPFIASWKNRKCVVKKAIEDKIDCFKQEVKILEELSQAQSPYIVQYYGKILSPHYCIVLEYVAGGDLLDLMNSNKQFPWKMRYSIMSDIAKGLACLHDQYRILHRDIKVENVLITENHRAKLCDFGHAINIKDAKRPRTTKDIVGTLETIAPEVYEAKAPSTKSDVYSMGITFWDISTRGEIFSDIPNLDDRSPSARRILQEKKLSGKPGKIPKTCSTSVAKLIKWCWKANPAERPEASIVANELTQITNAPRKRNLERNDSKKQVKRMKLK